MRKPRSGIGILAGFAVALIWVGIGLIGLFGFGVFVTAETVMQEIAAILLFILCAMLACLSCLVAVASLLGSVDHAAWRAAINSASP